MTRHMSNNEIATVSRLVREKMDDMLYNASWYHHDNLELGMRWSLAYYALSLWLDTHQ